MNILLGDAGSTHARLSQMAALLGSLPPGAVTSLAGRGRSQLATSVIALGEGCGVGVGRDEGAACDRGATRESNAMLLRRLATIACEMELEPAQPRQVRLLLGLRPGDGKYGLREASPATGAAH